MFLDVFLMFFFFFKFLNVFWCCFFFFKVFWIFFWEKDKYCIGGICLVWRVFCLGKTEFFGIIISLHPHKGAFWLVLWSSKPPKSTLLGMLVYLFVFFKVFLKDMTFLSLGFSPCFSGYRKKFSPALWPSMQVLYKEVRRTTGGSCGVRILLWAKDNSLNSCRDLPTSIVWSFRLKKPEVSEIWNPFLEAHVRNFPSVRSLRLQGRKTI